MNSEVTSLRGDSYKMSHSPVLFKCSLRHGKRGKGELHTQTRHFPHISLDKCACSGKQRWTGKLIWKRMHMFVLPGWRDATWKAGLLALGAPLMAPYRVYNVYRQFLSWKASGGLAGPKDPRLWWQKHLWILLGKGQFNYLSSLSLPSLLDPLGDSHQPPPPPNPMLLVDFGEHTVIASVDINRKNKIDYYGLNLPLGNFALRC